MAFWRALVQLQPDTALAEDVTVNTWHFESDRADDGDTGTALDLDSMLSTLTAFYTAIQSVLAGDFLTGTVLVRYYNMEEPEKRVPKREDTFAITPSTANPLPAENAIAVTCHGTFESGVPKARRRGRLYLGPITSAAVGVTAGRMHVLAATLTTVANAAAAAAGDQGVNNPRWAVFSRAAGQGVPVGQAIANEYDYSAAELAAGYDDVVGGWVDNAVDTQRRRGHRSTTRTLWVA